MQTVAGRILGWAAGVAVAALWIIGTTRARWAVRIPDAEHSYGIRFKGGNDLFFAPPIGWFIDNGIWICFTLLIAAAAAEWVGRRSSPSG